MQIERGIAQSTKYESQKPEDWSLILAPTNKATEEEWGALRRGGSTREELVKSLGLTGTVNPTEPIATSSVRDLSSKDKVDLRKVHILSLTSTYTHLPAHTHTPAHTHLQTHTHTCTQTNPTCTHRDAPTCTHLHTHT